MPIGAFTVTTLPLTVAENPVVEVSRLTLSLIFVATVELAVPFGTSDEVSWFMMTTPPTVMPPEPALPRAAAWAAPVEPTVMVDCACAPDEPPV